MNTIKKCTKCEIEKSLLDFCKCSTVKNGRRSSCKSCEKERNIKYSRTKEGVIVTIYKTQKASSKQRKHNPPTYSKKWLKDWLISNPEFHRIYDIWVISGYKKRLKPSIDRIDDYLGYTEYNIQLTVWYKNNKKSHIHRKLGISSSGEMCISVLQLNKDGSFVAEYVSFNDACRKTGVGVGNIASCCHGKTKTAGGYLWILS